MKHLCLENHPDDSEALGPFEIRPVWEGQDDDEDDWEVARPTTKWGKRHGIVPSAVAVCPDKAHAEAVRDALNAYVAAADTGLAS